MSATSGITAGRRALSAESTKAGRLQRASYDVLLQHKHDGALPTSTRFVFYELVQAGVVSKQKSGKRRPDQDVIEAMSELRERGWVPWSWIVDDTRELYAWDYGASVAQYLADAVDFARIDLWAGKPPPLIVCESRTFGGVLRRTLAPEYLCPVAATNGQAGGFLRTDVAKALIDGTAGAVLYVGDLDRDGGKIEANTRRVLEQAAGRELDWRRLALTSEQVKKYGLPVCLKVDRRYKDGGLHEAVEVEALGQVTVTNIVRAGLDALLPEPRGTVLEREREQREQMRAELLGLPRGSE